MEIDPEREACDNSRIETDLPPVLYLKDLSRFLRRSEKSIRSMIARGQVPKPGKIGGRLAWGRKTVLEFLSEIRTAEKKPTVQINVAPYKYDPARFQIMFTIPATKTEPRKRTSKVAPAGLDHDAALAWARRLEREVWHDLMGGTPEKKEEPKEEKKYSAPRKSSALTLSEFWSRFEMEYISLQKPATQKGYRAAWSKYIRPVLGSMPLDIIDRKTIANLRTAIGKLQPISRNQILCKLRTALDQAETWGLIESVPPIKADKVGRQPEPNTYSENQVADLIAAAKNEGREYVAIVFLLLHGGLRVSEVCALRWSDIDFSRGLMTIQHNFSAGEESTPKGGIAAPVGMSPDLVAALQALPRFGVYVLMRELPQDYGRGKRGDVVRQTPHSIRERLNTLQRAAGLPETGPHALRHTCLTILAARGLDPWKLQAHARHARISTTQRYVHLAKEAAALDAAAMWSENSQKKSKPARKGFKLVS